MAASPDMMRAVLAVISYIKKPLLIIIFLFLF